MDVKLTVTRTFVVNGKTYRSADELPPDIRAAIAQQRSSPDARSLARARVVFNGREYADETAMPADIRAHYRGVMAAAGLEMNRSACTSRIDTAPVTAMQSISSARRRSAVWIAAAVVLALAGFVYLR